MSSYLEQNRSCKYVIHQCARLHFHFLSSDLQHDGHLLACEPQKIEVGMQFIPRMGLALRTILDYLTWDFN